MAQPVGYFNQLNDLVFEVKEAAEVGLSHAATGAAAMLTKTTTSVFARALAGQPARPKIDPEEFTKYVLGGFVGGAFCHAAKKHEHKTPQFLHAAIAQMCKPFRN